MEVRASNTSTTVEEVLKQARLLASGTTQNLLRPEVIVVVVRCAGQLRWRDQLLVEYIVKDITAVIS